MSTQRPLSPHLQIYKPQLTSVLSILHRATGIALSLGLFPLVYWIWAIAEGETAYNDAVALYNGWFGLILLFGWTFSFFYHFANGIRHLFWDAGYGFELKEAYATGWIVVFFSLSFTLLTWIIGFAYTWRG